MTERTGDAPGFPPPRRPRSRQTRRRVPTHPPFPEDLVADLHAGVLDEQTAAELLPAVLADPDAAAFLRSLDSVRDGLARIGEAPGEGQMPTHVAARLRESLIDAPCGPGAHAGRLQPAEPEAPARVRGLRITRHRGTDARAEDPEYSASPADPRPWRHRRLLTAAAALVGGVLIVAPTAWVAMHDTHGDAGRVAADAPASGGPAVSGDDPAAQAAGGGSTAHGRNRPVDTAGGPLDDARILAASGRNDPGPFADPARLASCLAANGLPADSRLLGAGPVQVEDHEATLLLVPGEHPPILTGLVVTGDCGVAGNGLLYRTDIGD